MRSLLDISVLIPLFDAGHMHHNRAHQWWATARAQGWASCPLTENGFVRITSRVGYFATRPVQSAVAWLTAWMAASDHQVWPDDVSILDPTMFDHPVVAGPNQITDVYLLGLAVAHGGCLATFDQSIPLAAVRGAQPQHLVVL